jgi:glycosyltransferase involved in cell wall biosynthesis
MSIEKLKIVITTNSSWNVYNFRLGLIRTLLEEGFLVFVIAPKDEYFSKLEQAGIKCFDIGIDNKGTNPIFDSFLVFKYLKHLRNIRPQLMLSYTIKSNVYGNIAAQMLGIPVINTVSGLGTIFIKRNIVSYIGSLLYYLSFKKTDWVFFHNQTDRDYFIKKKIVKNDNSAVVGGSGVDLSKFDYNRQYNKGQQFLFVGRLLGDKGIREYINAAKKIIENNQSTKFIIIGELGSKNNTAITEKELNDLINHPQIIYKGKSDNIKEELELADVMVLPSYREGLSKSLIEAAAMKLPIITTDVPGCREVVVHGVNGYLCHPKNQEDLFNKILEMTNLTEEERVQMGKESRIIVEKNFDEKIVISKYLEKISVLVKD